MDALAFIFGRLGHAAHAVCHCFPGSAHATPDVGSVHKKREFERSCGHLLLRVLAKFAVTDWHLKPEFEVPSWDFKSGRG
ncbi:MAG: hypothetical protein NTW22_07635, partial [Proteobacteria bacterium]|nr:hypothetical protein [Pseudomonadota bacterium]